MQYTLENYSLHFLFQNQEDILMNINEVFPTAVFYCNIMIFNEIKYISCKECISRKEE